MGQRSDGSTCVCKSDIVWMCLTVPLMSFPSACHRSSGCGREVSSRRVGIDEAEEPHGYRALFLLSLTLLRNTRKLLISFKSQTFPQLRSTTSFSWLIKVFQLVEYRVLGWSSVEPGWEQENLRHYMRTQNSWIFLRDLHRQPNVSLLFRKLPLFIFLGRVCKWVSEDTYLCCESRHRGLRNTFI